MVFSFMKYLPSMHTALIKNVGENSSTDSQTLVLALATACDPFASPREGSLNRKVNEPTTFPLLRHQTLNA